MKMKPVSKKQNIVIQELENELLVYDLQTNKAFCLNETSAIIFQLCDGKRTVVEISDLMSRKLKALVSEDIVMLALNELKRNRLLENPDELNEFFAGMARREMVKKVGLASMIALPIVSSVVAPSAVLALSCVTSGNPAPGALLACNSNRSSSCNSTCNLNNSGQCCSMQAQASSQVSCSPVDCTCVCV